MLVVDNFLSADECSEIISMGYGKWKPSLTGTGEIFENFRKSKQISPNICKDDWLYQIVKRSFLKHNIEIIADVLREVQIIKYDVGDYILKHQDTTGYGLTGTKIDRYYVLNIILNDTFEGGDFVYYDINNNPITLEKKAGTGMIFKTNVFHQVNPITEGVRYSFCVFIQPTDFKLKSSLL
jgi:predicted 2-oxoglutarate/Fe(II)-dependent dioxygenase YbiX